jgi:hypothetical protein
MLAAVSFHHIIDINKLCRCIEFGTGVFSERMEEEIVHCKARVENDPLFLRLVEYGTKNEFWGDTAPVRRKTPSKISISIAEFRVFEKK